MTKEDLKTNVGLNEKNDVTLNEQVNEVPENTSITATSNFATILAKITANKDNKIIRGLKVRNVTINNDDEESKNITLVVDSDIPCFLKDESGEYKLGTTRNIITSVFAISGVLKEDENTAFLANYVVNSPKLAQTLLSQATINIVQILVKEGNEYVNPFTTKKNAEPYVSDHNFFANNVISIKLGVVGNKIADKLLDRLIDVSI